jgi:hypothetical protein
MPGRAVGAIGERSEGFHQASRNYAQASRDIETVQAGRQAATSEDVISAYQALRLEAHAAFGSRHVGVERTCADHPWLTAVEISGYDAPYGKQRADPSAMIWIF